MIHGDTIDEGGDDPNPSSCGGDGEDLDDALGVGGWGWNGGGNCEGFLFCEVKKRKRSEVEKDRYL